MIRRRELDWLQESLGQGQSPSKLCGEEDLAMLCKPENQRKSSTERSEGMVRKGAFNLKYACDHHLLLVLLK